MASTVLVIAVLITLMVMVLALVSFPILEGLGPRVHTFYSPGIESGLQLEISLNDLEIPTGGNGGNLTAEVSLYNALGQNVTVAIDSTAPTSTLANWGDYDYFCGANSASSFIVGYALFSGHYTAQNMSLAPAPLRLAPMWPASCITDTFLDIHSMTILAMSDRYFLNRVLPSYAPSVASINATNESCFNRSYDPCGPDADLMGYWNNTASSSLSSDSLNSTQFIRFLPGQYTLVASDFLNQTAFAYFRVR